jgi:hypothetical protein
MAKLALFVALLGLLAHSCTAQQSCTETFSRCCRQLGKPTRVRCGGMANLGCVVQHPTALQSHPQSHPPATSGTDSRSTHPHLQFKGKIVDLDGKRIGSATFCFTGTQNAPTSGFTRTRINGRGRKIRSGLRVDIGYIGPPPTTELTLAQSDNFTPVGIPPVVTPPLQEPPSSTVSRLQGHGGYDCTCCPDGSVSPRRPAYSPLPPLRAPPHTLDPWCDCGCPYHAA